MSLCCLGCLCSYHGVVVSFHETFAELYIACDKHNLYLNLDVMLVYVLC